MIHAPVTEHVYMIAALYSLGLLVVFGLALWWSARK